MTVGMWLLISYQNQPPLGNLYRNCIIELLDISPRFGINELSRFISSILKYFSVKKNATNISKQTEQNRQQIREKFISRGQVSSEQRREQ